MEYSFRNCTLEDFDFLFELKKENFKWYVDKIWGWKDDDQKERLQQDLNEHLSHKRIIMVNNKSIGVYVVHTTEDGDLFINEISILAEYQNKGIGRKILEEQLKENHKKGIRTILQVFKHNPAKKLYEQLGFKIYGETETHYQMENVNDFMINKEKIFPIGIGTWKINYQDNKDIEALFHSYKLGQNYLSLYMLYEDGNIVKSLKSFIEKCGRENLFISVNIEPTVNEKSDIEKQLNEYLDILNLDYVDNLQLHSPKFTKLPLLDTYFEMKRLQEIGKTRYLGISNCSLEQLKEINTNVKLDFFEGVYNLECKMNESIGILDYCKKNDIEFVAYQPLRRNRTQLKNYELLVELSQKYNKTQNQIILNWIMKEKKINVLIKSTNCDRIDENIKSLDFEMEENDYKRLNDFKNEEFENIKIDWDNVGDGIRIDQLPNQF